MSIFYCLECDRYADADDGCAEAPNGRDLICVDCMGEQDFCDLCGVAMEPAPAVAEVTGMNVCQTCVEATLEASVNTGATVELVGASR